MYPKKITFSAALRSIITTFLSAVTVTVFGVCTVSALSASDFGEYFPVRLMLGEFFGGIGNIEAVPSGAGIADYISPVSDADDEGDRLDPIDRVSSPPEERSAVQMTLASDNLSLVNETPYEPDTAALLESERAIPTADELYAEYGPDAPLVLILHTHGTEAFSECTADGYRSTDTAENIVSCGAVIAEILEHRGIHTIHSNELFDEDDFTMAYYNASLEIKRITEEYPSVSYIIDVHRDSILSDGAYIAPVTDTDSGSTAQMMFVIGTDYGGSGHTAWRNNLSLALRLQNSLNAETPQIMRTINLRSASFNEQYSDGSLLLEIGACGSSLEEAHSSAAIFAEALADEILGK